MNSIQHRPKRLESVISFCILVVLVIIAIAILIVQSDADITRFGIDTPAEQNILTILKSTRRAVAPSRQVVPENMESVKTENYTAAHLYEKINGKAPLYTDAGFVKLSTQLITDKNGNPQMEIFIYNMAKHINAFSVFSTQRRAGAEDLSAAEGDVSFGYKTSNAAYFVHGKYYIEIIGFSQSPQLFEKILEAAQNIKKQLPAEDKTEIPELALLEDNDLISSSINFSVAAVFGCDKLTGIFTAKYKINGEIITAFLARQTTPQVARQLAEDYHDFLIENGATLKQTNNKLLAGHVLDFYDTTEIVTAIGPFLIGIHEADNQTVAENLITKLIKKIEKLND